MSIFKRKKQSEKSTSPENKIAPAEKFVEKQIILQITNTSDKPVENVELFNSYANRNKSNYGLPQNIFIKSLIPDISYDFMLAESEHEGFKFVHTTIINRNITRGIGKEFNQITTNTSNGNSFGEQEIGEDIRFEIAPYQQAEDRGESNEKISIKGGTGIIIKEVPAYSTLEVRLFQMFKAPVEEVEGTWVAVDADVIAREFPIIIKVKNKSDVTLPVSLFGASKNYVLSNVGQNENIEIYCPTSLGNKQSGSDTAYLQILSNAMSKELLSYKINAIGSEEQLKLLESGGVRFANKTITGKLISYHELFKRTTAPTETSCEHKFIIDGMAIIDQIHILPNSELTFHVYTYMLVPKKSEDKIRIPEKSTWQKFKNWLSGGNKKSDYKLAA